MEVAAIWLVALVKALALLLINPVTYLALLLIIVGIYRQQRMERRQFGSRLHHPGEGLLHALGWGALLGLLISLPLVLFGLLLAPATFYILLALAVLLSLWRVRYLSFAYAGALLGAFSLITRWLPMPAGDRFPLWINDGLTVIWTTLQDISLPALLAFVALLHLAQAMLIAVSGREQMSPRWLKGKRGKLVGGYEWQPIWFLPIVVVSESGQAVFPFVPILKDLSYFQVGSLPALFQGWPLGTDVLGTSAGDLSVGLLWLPAILTFAVQVKATLPERVLRFSSRWMMVFALLLLTLSTLSWYWEWISVIALIFSFLGYHALYMVNRLREEEGEPIFVPPKDGLKILAVLPESPAEKLGLRADELISKVNGQPVTQSQQLYEALSLNKAYCKLEVINTEGEIKFVQGSLYEDDHHELGIILVPDDHAAPHSSIKAHSSTKAHSSIKEIKERHDEIPF